MPSQRGLSVRPGGSRGKSTRIIRDQKPLIESRLRDVRQNGMTPRDRYTLLNRKTFFWVSEKRFETLRNPRAYQGL